MYKHNALMGWNDIWSISLTSTSTFKISFIYYNGYFFKDWLRYIYFFTKVLHNADISRNQNARYAWNRCTFKEFLNQNISEGPVNWLYRATENWNFYPKYHLNPLCYQCICKEFSWFLASWKANFAIGKGKKKFPTGPASYFGIVSDEYRSTVQCSA